MSHFYKFFPGKSSDDLIKVKCKLHRQNPEPLVDYPALFEEDRDHNQGEFVECVRDQYLKEIQEYTKELELSILKIAKYYLETKKRKTPSSVITPLSPSLMEPVVEHVEETEEVMIPLSIVKDAFADVDPGKNRSKVERDVTRALEFLHLEKKGSSRKSMSQQQEELNRKTDKIKWKQEVPLQTFVRAFKRVLLIRRTKKEDVAAYKEKIKRKRRRKMESKIRKST
eukprot:CAMPEP_0117430316 /NCGR_PEP_ID=MMETSP0758-20121206/9836_1 /TAXON_ID=63605 /ORGANISM="Percolomonas cosmopolitus, Strain AE-1 (ATCC 50343)" /LENGTH=225 /DNA_ID=CAMNT_0005218175 /DNA_START=118 /DNA_END=791 /DNA_ORIENTATION=+